MIFELLQDALLSPPESYHKVIRDVRKLQHELDGVELARSQAVLRLLLALQEKELRPLGTSDIVVLFRQVIRYYEPLRVKHDFWQEFRSREDESSLISIPYNDDLYELLAHGWISDWLTQTSGIDRLEFKRTIQPVMADGMLYEMTRAAGNPFTTYQSEGQKEAVYASLFAPPGSSTLITLPTGGGKSMCILLPAWVDSRGGQYAGGTTIVIVPTVALAYDQEALARKYFKYALADEYQPTCLTGDTGSDVRANVRQGIMNGTIPIVYLSPESLLNSHIYTLVQNAVTEGKVTRFVIDEAHLIETWGANFRTEFQMLATYCQQLYILSKCQLRLILLSATISQSALNTLQQLFAFDNQFNILNINQLRPEIGFWFDIAPDNETRDEQIIEALRHLPRPAILYVTRPSHANEWVHRLKTQEGFERTASFSGETDAQERQKLINDWNQNKIDIMVATSAFGLGVNKADVRTVIHATVPESLDRFYQEVGRTGRDGISAISLTCVTQEDEKLAHDMTRSARITSAKAWERWNSMFQKNSRRREDKYWEINTAVPPINEKEINESDINKDWNHHVLLMMQRANLIRLVNLKPDPSSAEENSAVWVELLSQDVNTQEAFIRAIEPHRRSERNSLSQNLEAVKTLFHEYVKGTADSCISDRFKMVYDPVAPACGGCPICRQRQTKPYASQPKIELLLDSEGEADENKVTTKFKEYIGTSRTLHILWEGIQDHVTINRYSDLLGHLVNQGVQQLILPEELIGVNDHLAAFAFKPHLTIMQSKIRHTVIRPLNTVVMYPLDTRLADDIYKRIEVWHQNHNTKPFLVHVVHQQLELPSLHGQFRDRVHGYQVSAAGFRSWIKSLEQTL